MAVIGLQWVQKQTPVKILLLSRQSSIVYLPYFLHIELQNLLFLAFMDLYTQKNYVTNSKETLQNHITLCWILTSTHKHHKKSLQYSLHKCLLKKSCPHFLRILTMSWLFKDPVVWVVLLNYDQAQLSSRKWPKKFKLS